MRWQQSTWGRVLIGLCVAQGLLYGLRLLLTGGLQALQADGNPDETWGTPAGLILLQCLRLGTLIVGALLAGGGQRLGLVLGTFVGAFNAVVTLILQPGPGQVVSTVEMYGQPLLQAAVGALGGWLGCLFWAPLPESVPAAQDLPRSQRSLRPRYPLFAGRVAWFRVMAGVTLAVAGHLSANALFDVAIAASDGKLGTTDEMQDKVVTWEIKALALLLGGTIAGSATNNGLKQGLAVGIGTSAILVGAEVSRHENWIQLTAVTLVSALSLGLAGGWFGCQLFPPVVRIKRKKAEAAL
jgi:hypothetical protein